MDFSLVPPFAWGILAASIILAIVLEGALVQILLEVVRPVSKYIFLVARVGKLAAMVGWFAFFNLYWFQTYLANDRPMPTYIPLIEWVLVGIFIVLAFTTMPRVQQRSPAAGTRV